MLYCLQKIFIPFLGLLMLILLPISSTKAKPFENSEFSFESKKLVRGQENTINFTLNNLSTTTWISVVGLGIPANSGIEIRSPKHGTFAGINYGPWEINYVSPERLLGLEELSQSYQGYVWSVVQENGNFITGRQVIPPQKSEKFSLKIFVPETAPLGDILIAEAAAHYGSYMLSYQINEIKFQIVDPASSAQISKVSELPQTGSNLNYLILLVLPSLYLARKFILVHF